MDREYSGDSDPHQEAAAYIQALHGQHVSMVDNMVASFYLWSPELLYPIIEALGVLRTIVRLNDGRECEVITYSNTAETMVTPWSQT